MQDVEDRSVSDSSSGWVMSFPDIVSACRDPQALDSQGLTDLLDCIAALTLLVDEFGD